MIALCGEIVKLVLEDWDPLGFIDMGAFDNEYDYEVDIIMYELNWHQEISIDCLADIIQESFVLAFGKEIFDYPIEAIYPVAENILTLNLH